MPTKKPNKKSRTLSKKSKNNSIKNIVTNKFVILAFVAVVAAIGIFAIYQSRAAEQYGPFTISRTDDTMTQSMGNQWINGCYSGFKNRGGGRSNGGPTPQTANTLYYNNDNNDAVLNKYSDCYTRNLDAFYSQNKYKYQTMIKGGGADLKACRVSNDPNLAVKVRLFPNWETVDQRVVSEVERLRQGGVNLTEQNKKDMRLRMYQELYGGGASGLAYLVFDNPATRAHPYYFPGEPIASKKLFYETDYLWESNVTIATGEFSGYFSELNNNNPNPKAKFSIGWVDVQQTHGWGDAAIKNKPPDVPHNEFKEVRFLDIPKCS